MERNDFGLRPWDLTSSAIEPPKELNPYQKLFLAILMDAVETLKKPPKAIVNRYIGKRQYKVKEPGPLDPIGDAHAWLMSDDDCVLGFVSICEYLKQDPGSIRKRALKAINEARAQPQGARRNRVATDGKRRRKRG